MGLFYSEISRRSLFIKILRCHYNKCLRKHMGTKAHTPVSTPLISGRQMAMWTLTTLFMRSLELSENPHKVVHYRWVMRRQAAAPPQEGSSNQHPECGGKCHFLYINNRNIWTETGSVAFLTQLISFLSRDRYLWADSASRKGSKASKGSLWTDSLQPTLERGIALW